MTPAKDWLQMLRDAVTTSTQTAVAARLDVSRTTVSLVLAGKYPGKTDRVAARVMNVLGQVKCTHTAEPITQTVCLNFAARRTPTRTVALAHVPDLPAPPR